jgi:predicted Fe-Mo cluster-binding NifX family protein
MVYVLNHQNQIRSIEGENVMKTRIIVPVDNEDGFEAPVAEHFGRANYFAVVDLDEKGAILSVKTEANKGEHHGGRGHPHENLLALKPNVIIACGMGPGGMLGFENAGVKLLKATPTVTVQEMVAQYEAGKLEKLTGGCEHAHHHNHVH